jgi:K+-sensing histidine kinase KdpD
MNEKFIRPMTGAQQREKVPFRFISYADPLAS